MPVGSAPLAATSWGQPRAACSCSAAVPGPSVSPGGLGGSTSCRVGSRAGARRGPLGVPWLQHLAGVVEAWGRLAQGHFLREGAGRANAPAGREAVGNIREEQRDTQRNHPVLIPSPCWCLHPPAQGSPRQERAPPPRAARLRRAGNAASFAGHSAASRPARLPSCRARGPAQPATAPTHGAGGFQLGKCPRRVP